MSLVQLTIYKDEVGSEIEIIKTFDNDFESLRDEMIDLVSYDISFSVDYI